MSANHRFETLFDLTARNLNLRVECKCGHRGTLEALKLSRWFLAHGWDQRVHALPRHLRCSRCGARPVLVRPAGGQPLGPKWGPQSEAEWERLVKRLRNR